ncbi:putative cytochrome P450 6a13 [Pseudolycoriella hygida]|uniref:Cytochrome P450 6a13 n=1 Tax=Pseudolycoriella hygida TaxID=35572 RepID=A0A9Q0S1S3_9DIPT|nr:putative cytochrome P450 6a13 [Pseudolycoriella hygida]
MQSLRKYSPVGNLRRMATKDYNVPKTNVVLPKGTKIMIPVHAIHHDPTYYPNPSKFDPDRFTPEEMSKDNGNVSEMDWQAPAAQGLYDPQNEHEACGVGFIVAIDGRRSHKILRDAQILSSRMNHRGACACDNDTGDGAGVMTAIPHGLYAARIS